MSGEVMSQAAWEDLQMRLAFQEDALLTLSDQVALQAEELRRAQLHIHVLNQKINDLLQGLDQRGPVENTRPPHY
jgi:uncharacterized coiled-coil protein SlyX